MDAFLIGFWPNLAATVLGVIIAAPIALALDRRLLEYQRRLEDERLRRRVRDAIDVLIGACRYNIKLLDNMRELSTKGVVMRNPDLRLTTWDAVGYILAEGCPEPEVLQMLSHHWLRLKRAGELSDEIFAREVAKSLPPIEDNTIVKQYWQTLHDTAFDLAGHARQAVDWLGKTRTDLEQEAGKVGLTRSRGSGA